MTYTTTNGWTIPTATATYSVGFDSIFDRLERLNTPAHPLVSSLKTWMST